MGKRKKNSDRDIWILDETGDLSSFVEGTLGARYHYHRFCEPQTFLEHLAVNEPALIVTQPELNGNCVSKLMREISSTPVIVISSNNDKKVISNCLEAGASDFILEPVDCNVFTAKVRLLLNRRSAPKPLRFGDLYFDFFTLSVADPGGFRVKLTKTEFQILENIAKSSPEGKTPTDLRKEIWGEYTVVSKSLDVHLFKLRRKLEPLGQIIRFHRGKYQLVREDS